MPDDLIIHTATSRNTLVYGRTLNSARAHHFIIDGARDPNEELTPVEVFLSAVSACCVQWVEQFAREDGVDLRHIEVSITSTRTAAEFNRFQSIEMVVKGDGPSLREMEDFVERFRRRCPLYATVSASTRVDFRVDSAP